jgi:hypothetical protein
MLDVVTGNIFDEVCDWTLWIALWAPTPGGPNLYIACNGKIFLFIRIVVFNMKL